MRRRETFSVNAVLAPHFISIKSAFVMWTGRHTRRRTPVAATGSRPVDPAQLYWITKFNAALPLPAVIAPVVGAYLALPVKR